MTRHSTHFWAPDGARGLLQNGNNMGSTGISLAKWQEA
jgi:hypothetical protein